MKEELDERILIVPVLVLVPVLVMAALYPIAWLTFKRERGEMNISDDFFKLTTCRQRNIDYSICQAAAYKAGDVQHQLGLLEIYDIGCHWSINFLDRVERNPTMNFNSTIDFIVAVGKFHLGAHVKECFFKHSLNFITGAGQVDGEIMETLWSLFNKFAKMARSMGSAHRKEILNDHMRDVNWKKLVGMGEYFFFFIPNLNLSFEFTN